MVVRLGVFQCAGGTSSMSMNKRTMLIIDLPWLQAKSDSVDCTAPCRVVPMLFSVIGYDKRQVVGKIVTEYAVMQGLLFWFKQVVGVCA